MSLSADDVVKLVEQITEYLLDNEDSAKRLMAKMKEGTATRADKEMLVAMNVNAEKRKSEKDELGALDTATLLSRSAAVAEKMREGTATRADKEMLHAMTATAEKRKDEMDGLRTADCEDSRCMHLVKRKVRQLA